jgi:hypothetical protein
MTPAQRRQLVLRSNRHLGAALVDADLVKVEGIESANGRLLDLLAAGNPRLCSVLGVLAYEMKTLREEETLQLAIDEHGDGLIDLRHCEIAEGIRHAIDPAACWATWTLPFGREDGFNLVATAYGLSSSVRAYWEKHLAGPIIWYGTTLEMIADQLEKNAGTGPAPAGPA